MTLLIDAKMLKEEKIASMKEDVKAIQRHIKRVPKLVIISASNDLSSKAYIKNKVKLGEEVGIDVVVEEFGETITQEELYSEMDDIVYDKKVDGVILQLPIYSHLDQNELISIITPEKDADCFTDERLGQLIQNKGEIRPCTPKGVIELLDYHNVDLEGKRVAIVGRSVHVGLSLSTMLTQRGCVVTTTHSKTPSLEEDIRNADIVVSCVGKSELIKPEWMKEKSILIGVGITFKDGDFKQYTDYDVDTMLNNSKCSMVGNRVNASGTATVVSLIENTITLCLERMWM